MVKYDCFLPSTSTCVNICVFSSQAAIQASKLRAKEVDLTHFEWAKVDRLIVNQWSATIPMHMLGSNSYGSREEEPIS